MATYTAGASLSGINTANSGYLQLRPTSTAARLFVREIGIGVSVAPTTAPSFYLSRSTANGTITTTLAGQPNDPADAAAVGTVDSVFSVQPTFSTTSKLRQGGLAVTAGGQLIWVFDEPIVIDRVTSNGLVIVNANASGATTGTFAGYFTWEE